MRTGPVRPLRRRLRSRTCRVGCGSQEVNDEPNVAPATAARVWDAVRALDYHIDLQAGSLRRTDGRTRTLGLLVGSVDNPFSGVIHRVIEEVSLRREVAVFASSLDDDPEREERAVAAFLRRRVDGLILTTAQRRPGYLGAIEGRGIPVVYIDREPAAVGVDAVASDNRGGADAATTHLIARGHRRIALLADRLEIQSAQARRDGFLDAMGRAGIPTSLATIVTELHDEAAARAALTDLLESHDPPTAVFSGQNLITVGALHALRAHGLQHTVALVGFDDVPLADLVDPGVTVVAQDPHEIGRVAVERMFARLEGDASPPRHLLIPTTLIARGSGEIPPPA
ncbi:LacI family transcriptional regulator [Microbacterium saccharophilum]|uniref:LacI family transcriptional regulator n=1 Tax=Microbacterium saccharophilum TaxID=1213358 RepID=A0A5C8I7G3_9MICO|nr:LacI family DNA-binding transcriptional regulator [Microbacterium saccharophilum]TXK13914.1 LacI family transcriptional regulator [Microbacterium saccharophilum]